MTIVAGGPAVVVQAGGGGGITAGTPTTAALTTDVEGGAGFTIAYPTVSADDFLLLWWGIRAGAGSFATYVTNPSGFTEPCPERRDAAGDDRMTQFVYKRAIGDESGNLSMKWQQTAGATATGFAIMVPLTGVDWGVGPFESAPDSHAITANSTYHLSGTDDPSPTCASITTVASDSEIVHMTCLTGGTVTNVSTDIGAEIAKVIQSGSQDISAYMSNITKAVGGSQTGATHTYAGGGGGDDYQSMVIALRAA